MDRVPVMSGLRCLELADPSRVRCLAKAPNTKVIRRHRDRLVVEIQIHETADDSDIPARSGNPLRYSHDNETGTNPPRVWTLKRIPRAARPAFTAVLQECHRAA
jgi:hypothetical protein